LHLPPLDLVLPPIFNYKPKQTFVLDRILFAQALAIIPHLSLGGFFGMVYEHLLGCFIPEDLTLGFSKLFQDFVVVVHEDILRLVALVLKVNKLLTMAKDTGGFRLIVISKVFPRLINHSIVL
jgi:hypothetical protein